MATAAPDETETQRCIAPRVNPQLAFQRGTVGGSLRPIAFPPDTTTTLSLFVMARWPVDILDLSFDSPWPTERIETRNFEPESETRPYRVVMWEITAPSSTETPETVSATVEWEFPRACADGTATIDQPITVSQTTSAPLGWNAGGWCKTDRWVRIDDLWFDNGTEGNEGTPYVSVSGGASSTDGEVHAECSDAGIVTTEHDLLYQTTQAGVDLGYDVAIENGTYDVRLHFAEIDEDVHPGDRVFDLSVQGTVRLEAFDIAEESEYNPVPDETEFHNVARTRTVEGVEVTDGALSITTESIEGDSLVSGFAIREAGDDPGGS